MRYILVSFWFDLFAWVLLLVGAKDWCDLSNVPICHQYAVSICIHICNFFIHLRKVGSLSLFSAHLFCVNLGANVGKCGIMIRLGPSITLSGDVYHSFVSKFHTTSWTFWGSWKVDVGLVVWCYFIHVLNDNKDNRKAQRKAYNRAAGQSDILGALAVTITSERDFFV